MRGLRSVKDFAVYDALAMRGPERRHCWSISASLFRAELGPAGGAKRWSGGSKNL